MRADPGALAALCEKTDNDIRACINTLQVSGADWGGGCEGPGAGVRWLAGAGAARVGVQPLTLHLIPSSCMAGAGGS